MARGKTKKDFIFAVGKRKASVARIRLFRGKGEILVNETAPDEYFDGSPADEVLWKRPFHLTDTEGKFYVTAKIQGGGKRSQLDAFVHGVSRALARADEENFKPTLKKYGLLTRDARVKERRKVGTGGKARRKKQSPKR